MFVPFIALPLAASWIAIADAVPTFDVTASCRGAAAAGYFAQTADRLQSCLDSEQRTREGLLKDWTTFPAADRAYCTGVVRGFEPTYTELATCLEMKRAVKNTDNGADMPSAVTSGPRRRR